MCTTPPTKWKQSCYSTIKRYWSSITTTWTRSKIISSTNNHHMTIVQWCCYHIIVLGIIKRGWIRLKVLANHLLQNWKIIRLYSFNLTLTVQWRNESTGAGTYLNTNMTHMDILSEKYFANTTTVKRLVISAEKWSQGIIMEGKVGSTEWEAAQREQAQYQTSFRRYINQLHNVMNVTP